MLGELSTWPLRPLRMRTRVGMERKTRNKPKSSVNEREREQGQRVG